MLVIACLTRADALSRIATTQTTGATPMRIPSILNPTEFLTQK
jgi:hypothetical protein